MRFLRPLRLLAEALTTDTSPRQLAVAASLGMVIGLVPKGNLTAILLMAILCMLRVNLGMGMLVAVAFSWLGSLADPLTHAIGLALLESDSLAPLWGALYNTPVVPWTGFNNTVVLGSFVLGFALAVPAYWISKPLFARYTPVLSARLGQTRLVRLLWSTELLGTLRNV